MSKPEPSKWSIEPVEDACGDWVIWRWTNYQGTPPDGEVVLVMERTKNGRGGALVLCYAEDDGKYWIDAGDPDNLFDTKDTHWVPVPPKPKYD
jgi:hypothetical protein